MADGGPARVCADALARPLSVPAFAACPSLAPLSLGYGDLDEDLLRRKQRFRRWGIVGERGKSKVRVRPRLRSSQRSHGGRVDRWRVLRPLARELGGLVIDGVSGVALLVGNSRAIPCQRLPVLLLVPREPQAAVNNNNRFWCHDGTSGLMNRGSSS